MVKHNNPDAEPKEPMSIADHNKAIILDRWHTFLAISQNRSAAAGDPVHVQKAVDYVMNYCKITIEFPAPQEVKESPDLPPVQGPELPQDG